MSGLLGCNVSPGAPGTEICNNLDDDCDGQTDEVSPTLCAVTGQACANGTCACPAGQSVCGTSCQAVGGACTAGTGACTRQGSVLCTNGTAACNAVPGTPGTETCNNLDDNCNGQTDEASATLCPATGQSCSLGTCSCPSGQTVCGTSCQTLGGSCSAGVGACLRSGAVACISGGAACNATAGSPVAETCDGVDNDCDGTVDNGVTITCYPDGDNDLFATSTTPSQQCPDNARQGFGRCPAGFVSPATSAGIDCDAANPNLYRLVPTRADADGDTYCVGSATTLCVGATAPAGRRFSSSCAVNDDCNDASAGLFQNLFVRIDADGDGYCVGGTSTQCAGTTPVAGTRLASSCSTSPDCLDSNANLFRNYDVRADADNDGYCAGIISTQCSGNAPPAGTRVSTFCQGEDCRDSNPNATTACVLPQAYRTASATKQCGFGFPASQSFSVAPVATCPVGFQHLFGFIGGTSANFTAGPTSNEGCAATSDTSLSMTCNSLVFGSFDCQVVGDCVAN